MTTSGVRSSKAMRYRRKRHRTAWEKPKVSSKRLRNKVRACGFFDGKFKKILVQERKEKKMLWLPAETLKKGKVTLVREELLSMGKGILHTNVAKKDYQKGGCVGPLGERGEVGVRAS